MSIPIWSLINCLKLNSKCFTLLVYVARFCLPNTVYSVECLSFKLWVPVRVKEEQMIPSNEIETYTPSRQGQQHDLQGKMSVVVVLSSSYTLKHAG